VTRTKRLFTAAAVVLVTAGATVSPALADTHATGVVVTTKDVHATGGEKSTQDTHAT
jgi:hypothetical protein